MNCLQKSNGISTGFLKDINAGRQTAYLVEVFTDAGIKGIGGATQYGGPDVVKKYLEKVIKPAITGKNPFDIEFLTCGVKVRGPYGRLGRC